MFGRAAGGDCAGGGAGGTGRAPPGRGGGVVGRGLDTVASDPPAGGRGLVPPVDGGGGSRGGGSGGDGGGAAAPPRRCVRFGSVRLRTVGGVRRLGGIIRLGMIVVSWVADASGRWGRSAGRSAGVGRDGVAERAGRGGGSGCSRPSFAGGRFARAPFVDAPFVPAPFAGAALRVGVSPRVGVGVSPRVGGVASPRLGGVASPRVGGVVSPRLGGVASPSPCSSVLDRADRGRLTVASSSVTDCDRVMECPPFHARPSGPRPSLTTSRPLSSRPLSSSSPPPAAQSRISATGPPLSAGHAMRDRWRGRSSARGGSPRPQTVSPTRNARSTDQTRTREFDGEHRSINVT